MPDGRDPDSNASAGTTTLLGSLACDPLAPTPSYACEPLPTFGPMDPDTRARLLDRAALGWHWTAEATALRREQSAACMAALASMRASVEARRVVRLPDARLVAAALVEADESESDDGEGRAFTFAGMGWGGWGR